MPRQEEILEDDFGVKRICAVVICMLDDDMWNSMAVHVCCVACGHLAVRVHVLLKLPHVWAAGVPGSGKEVSNLPGKVRKCRPFGEILSSPVSLVAL